MKVRYLTAILMLGLVSCETSVGDKPATGFLDQSVLVEGTEYLYQIYVPRQYDGRSEAPLILYLHGCGFDRWGNDGSRHTRFALGDTIRADPQNFPAIVIFPQMPLRTHWLGIGNQVARSALESFSTDHPWQAFRVPRRLCACRAHSELGHSCLQHTPL